MLIFLASFVILIISLNVFVEIFSHIIVVISFFLKGL